MDPLPRSSPQSANDPKKPQTPGSKIGSFFGWKQTASPGTESSVTEVSDNGTSPLPSPLVTSPQTSAYSSRSNPASIDVGKPNGVVTREGNFGGPLVQHQKSDSELSTKVGQLEGELREISSELAGSIRREIELEDLVEKLQSEMSQGSDAANRTSDYFSDSGIGSLRAVGDGRNKTEEIERIKRDSEQQRAQLKVSLSEKWQDERSRRKELESHVQLLEEQVSRFRRGQAESSNMSSRAKELETAIEDVRRRLMEERRLKENLEDLLTALRVDLEQHRNERDNLRDEVVPKLKAQLRGLEANASTSQQGNYDFARMQKEIQVLKQENASLMSARKLQQDVPRFNSIAEEGELHPRRRTSITQRSGTSLSRSNSVAQVSPRSPPFVGGVTRSGSLSRSNSISGRNTSDLRESLVDRVKDVELQRDTLHSALKLLLLRQEHQDREHAKRVRLLEAERDKALQASSTRKSGYENEVRGLRGEINYLRQRADDALHQKFQTEKGLGGLKMDLDRNKQETSSLRSLLQKRDSTVPEQMSSSLQQAYNQLQQDRKQVESWQPKDMARSLEEERKLADQLQQSAKRSESLSSQVRQQLETNASLRDRLATAVTRGERNQHASADQINELQRKLRKLEDTVTLAQAQSETAVMKHEEEIRVLTASHNAQLLRMKAGLRTPTPLSPTKMPRSPLTPMFANGGRSPRLDRTSSGPGIALSQALKTEHLETKVGELESALTEADKEMQQVVQRMNSAQIEVADLQTERYVWQLRMEPSTKTNEQQGRSSETDQETPSCHHGREREGSVVDEHRFPNLNSSKFQLLTDI
jgi:DNA repair exonuclease SbcCD ATPase subunit